MFVIDFDITVNIPFSIGLLFPGNIPVLFRTTEHINERYIRFEATSILLPYIELEFMQESNGEDAHQEKSQPHRSATSEDRDLNECASLDYMSRLVIKVHFRRYSLLFQVIENTRSEKASLIYSLFLYLQYTFGLMFRSILENYLLESLLNLQNMLNVDTIDFL